MIELSNGYKLDFVALSGALGFDGNGYWWEQPLKLASLFDTSLFTPITKTITRWKQPGNCGGHGFNCIKFLKDGVVNSMGLGNPGIRKWIEKNTNYNGIVSIYPENEYIHMIRTLNTLKNIKAVELNVSCPNITENIICKDIEYLVKKAKKETELPLLLKINVLQKDINFSLIEEYIEAISINSVPWKIIFKDKPSPFEKYGGGAVSGKAAQKYNWVLIKHLIDITSIPIIGADVWEYEDIDRLYNIGCKAIGFGCLFLRYPWKPTMYVRRYKKVSKLSNHCQNYINFGGIK